MTAKELAARYEAKIFETPEAARAAGFVLTETVSPRNVWNKSSAASAIIYKLLVRKQKGEAKEIGLVIESWKVTGCYIPAQEAEAAS